MLLTRVRTSSPFNPTSIFTGGFNGFSFDIQNTAHVWQDAARTVPGAANSVVGGITDGSGNGNHFSISTTSLKPLLRLVGGKYYLDWDGVDDVGNILNCLTIMTGWTGASVFASIKVPSATPAANKSNLMGLWGNPGAGSCYPLTTGNIAPIFGNSPGVNVVPGIALTNWHNLASRSQVNQFELYLNSGLVGSTGAGNTVPLLTGNPSYPCFGDNGFGDQKFVGFTGRMLGVNKYVSDTEMSNLNTWLSASY